MTRYQSATYHTSATTFDFCSLSGTWPNLEWFCKTVWLNQNQNAERDSRVVNVSDLNAEGPGSNPGVGKEI